MDPFGAGHTQSLCATCRSVSEIVFVYSGCFLAFPIPNVRDISQIVESSSSKNATIAQQHLNKVHEVFNEIHPDLGKILVLEGQAASSHHHKSSSKKRKLPPSSDPFTSNNGSSSSPIPPSSMDCKGQEERAMDLLFKFVQEHVQHAHQKSSTSQVQKKVQHLLTGFRSRATKTRDRYDINYYNAQNRRFRSRIEVARFLNVLTDLEPTKTKSSSIKRRKVGTSQQEGEKKKIRQELDRLRKAYQRATKALDEYNVTPTTTNESSFHVHSTASDSISSSAHVINTSDPLARTTAAAARVPDIAQFPDIPIRYTPEVIMAWDFLCTFERALNLAPIALDDFASALTYIPPYGQVGDDVVAPPVYLVEAHLALLKLLFQDKSSDEWWWSILETEQTEGVNKMEQSMTGDDEEKGDDNRPVIRIDMGDLLSEVEDPLITMSWLTSLEKLERDMGISRTKKTILNTIRASLKLATNKYVTAYLRKCILVCNAGGASETQRAIRWLVHHVRAARPDLGERGVSQGTVLKARDKVLSDTDKQMEILAANAPAVVEADLLLYTEDDDDDESDEESDDEENVSNGFDKEPRNESERPSSALPPKPLPTLVDLLLPPFKPQPNSEYVDAFSWSHLAGATVVRVLHRKKRLLNESDDAIRAANALPHITVSDRREREKLTASRILTEVEDVSEFVLEKASKHLCDGGNYLDLSPQERLCILRILIEASYDTVRVYDVVSGNYKQRISAMKALEVEERRAKREAKEKSTADEVAARERLAATVRERFLEEKREEIRQLNEKSKEFSEDAIESLTDEDIIEFDDDIKADYEALPGPESFTKTEVNQMVTKLAEEAAFETHELRVLSMDELLEKERRELDELEGRFSGFGGESALVETSLDRDTLRTLQGLRREVERARALSLSLPDLRETALVQLKDALDDGRIKVLKTAFNAAKKAKLVGSDDETGGVWALDLMRDAALELEKAKQNKRVLDAQKDLVAKRNKCFLRTEPMGCDQFGNRFWRFNSKIEVDDVDDGRIWVEAELIVQKNSDASNQTPSGYVNLTRESHLIAIGAPDMEDDFSAKDPSARFRTFSRREYHSEGFSSCLAQQHWGCHVAEESLRLLVKGLNAFDERENSLKTKLKEILEDTLGSGEPEKVDAAEPRTSDEVISDEGEADLLRYDGDEAVFIEAKDAAAESLGADAEAFEGIYSGIGEKVRIREVIDPFKDPPIARYESGIVDAWKLSVTKLEAHSNGEVHDHIDSEHSKTLETPHWRAVSERGRIIWLTGEVLMESLSRYKKWRQGQGYFENDSAFFLYRNSVGRYCGKASEAAYAASPYVFAKLMLKKEAELYPKLKTRNMENSWSGQNGARAMWTNSMRDYAYDFQTVQQGLVTLENALFELTGGFTQYKVDDKPVDVVSLLSDPKAVFEIELESMEKGLPGLWNSPSVRAVFLHIVEHSKTTGFLALALDLLCRNTMKYLQTHNLLNARGIDNASVDLMTTNRNTRRMNAWQQQQNQWT
jgi:DDT domain/Williams-Beuren syndrome DDT (WSD), D-TOX E motif/WSTF, HB1, Itc1p, MBD9 motif 1